MSLITFFITLLLYCIIEQNFSLPVLSQLLKNLIPVLLSIDWISVLLCFHFSFVSLKFLSLMGRRLGMHCNAYSHMHTVVSFSAAFSCRCRGDSWERAINSISLLCVFPSMVQISTCQYTLCFLWVLYDLTGQHWNTEEEAEKSMYAFCLPWQKIRGSRQKESRREGKIRKKRQD